MTAHSRWLDIIYTMVSCPDVRYIPCLPSSGVQRNTSLVCSQVPTIITFLSRLEEVQIVFAVRQESEKRRV
jgi:hypothetical protein